MSCPIVGPCPGEPGVVAPKPARGSPGIVGSCVGRLPFPVPEPGRPGMQLHLEVEVSDLDAAVEHAVELGATLAAYQPQDDVRVMLDPAGHPFCLYT